MFEKALEIHKDHGPPQFAAADHMNIGNVYFEQKEFEKAKRAWLEAREVYKSEGVNDMHMFQVVTSKLSSLPSPENP